jgi:PST family polysaccharide transporter
MQQLADVVTKPGFQKAAANFGWLLAERAARLVLGVVVGFLVARHLGPESLGRLSYATALVTLAGSFASFGLDQVVRRDLLTAPDSAASLLAGSALIRFSAGLAAYAVVILLLLLGVGLSEREGQLLAIVGLTLLQPAGMVSDLWLQAHLKARYSVWAQTGALAAGAAVRLWLISTNASLAAFAWVVTLEAALAAAGITLLARRAGLRFGPGALRRETTRRLVAEGWPLMFAGVAVVVYMKIDEVMLRHMAGAAAVGIYSAATRLTEIWYFLPMALGSSLLPALLRARERGAAADAVRLQQYYDLNAAVAYGLSVPLALAAPWVVAAAYGPAFAESAPIVSVHIWSSVFVFLGVARGQWLVNEGLQRFYLGATLAGALLNIALNLVMIPRWGGLGAALATVIAQAAAAWLSSYVHPATRKTAGMQTRALLVPLLGWRHLRRA